jgi:hypothetical protein
MSRSLAAPAVALASLLAACGGGGGGGGGHVGNPCGGGAACGAVALSLDAVSGSGSANALAPAAGVRMARAMAVSLDWQSGGIISGPPDELRLYVKSIAAAAAGGGLVSLFESADARGTLVSLTTGKVDLAAALGASGFALPPGTYTRLELTVSRVAEVSGCVSGKFMVTSPVTGLVSSVNPAWAAAAPLHAANTYSNDPIADGQVHTFCTRAGADEVTVGTFTTDPIGSNADFEAATSPALTEIDLALDNAGDLSTEALLAATVTVDSTASFTVAEGSTTPLSLAMDLNRMLRYFANTRSDLQPPNPNMKAGTSYFFTTVFPFSTVLVPGEGGSVEGYQLTVVGTKGDGSTEVVPGWLTVLRDAGGAVVGGVVMGDDDDALTVAKGNLLPVAADNGDGTWDLGYGLGAGGGGAPFTGLLRSFAFTALGGTGDCALTVSDAPWLSAFTGFHAYYTREL